MKAYGYFIALNGDRVAESETLYLSEKDVRKEMLDNLVAICQQIADSDKADVFHWPNYDGTFDPNNPRSCDSDEDFRDCLETYERVRSIIAEKTISVGDMSAIVEVPGTGNRIRVGENGCPYNLEWATAAYTIKERYER
jgi:hypothetical protein